eukprot:351054-Chlamydomonas_euryale.AAC.3
MQAGPRSVRLHRAALRLHTAAVPHVPRIEVGPRPGTGGDGLQAPAPPSAQVREPLRKPFSHQHDAQLAAHASHARGRKRVRNG